MTKFVSEERQETAKPAELTALVRSKAIVATEQAADRAGRYWAPSAAVHSAQLSVRECLRILEIPYE